MSAVMASPAVSGSAASVPADPVRALQHALYRAAKADPGRRFHALRDKILRSDVLCRAWVAVRRNNGAPGIDKITLAQVEEQMGFLRANRSPHAHAQLIGGEVSLLDADDHAQALLINSTTFHGCDE